MLDCRFYLAATGDKFVIQMDFRDKVESNIN